MLIIYNILFFLFAWACLPCLYFKGKWHSGFYARLGFLPPLEKEAGRFRTIWIHAVSVGEVLAVLDVIDALRKRFPREKIVLSTVTPAGHDLAQARLKGQCAVIYAPVDFPWAVRRYIQTLRPRIYLSAETEIWPNLFTLLHQNHVPIVQINGRISDQAFRGYQKVRFLTRRILNCVSVFCVQTPLDAERLIDLGAEHSKVHVVGNLKFDNLPARGFLKKENLGFAPEDQLWIAGSTHPGEERIVLDIFKNLTEEFPRLRLVVAPRHVERTLEVSEIVKEAGFQPLRFSQTGGAPIASRTVVVIDTIGHLRDLYDLADVVFIGKTLTVPGGQNMIEPVSFGKPTLVGPHTENFKDVTRIFLEAGALIQVQSGDELSSQIRDLLRDPRRRTEMAVKAGETMKKLRGAAQKTMDIISEILTP